MALSESEKLLHQFKESVLNIDPVYFVENHLTIDGDPFNLSGGYKPFADIYRYICLKAVEPNTLPVVLVKGRQVGATTMAAALEAYFMGCNIYGNSGRPPMRIMHLFPTLGLAAAYTKDKLTPIIQQSVEIDELHKDGTKKSFMEAKMDTSSPANDNMHYKKFLGGNQIWIESTGLNADRIRGRQLCLETELPTPSGFIKLKHLKLGDKLYDENGQICNVTKLHPIQESPESYRITFDDGTTVDACAEHLWVTYTKRDRINRKKGKIVEPKVKNTKQILQTLMCGKENNHAILNCKAISGHNKELPIDPYIFGIWLGDGDNFYNKHIPDDYLFSSENNRLALLQGLMDSDGCCYKDGRCEFTQTLKRSRLVDDVYKLICSLGIKARVYHVRYNDKYSIMFKTSKNVFRLNRKALNQKKDTNKNVFRYITKIDAIDSKPMRCITVDSPSHMYLITKSYLPTHNTVDALFFDEIQDMSAQAIGAAGKIATKANYGETNQGINVLFGTPKHKGGAYWKMWQSSNQQYFHLFCESCSNHFPLYRPDVNWEDIWLTKFIVRCTFCGHEQDKRIAAANGKWIPMQPGDNHFQPRMIGYHINQLYIPTFEKEHIIKQKPGIHTTNTEKIYMNEVLGEFYDGEAGTITKEEILENSLEDRAYAKIITPSDGVRVYAGFDWGQKANLDGAKGGKSFSCAVILTAHGPELFSVDFATRLKRNDFQEKQSIVEEMFRRYSVTLSVGDIGDATDLTEVLQRAHGDSFLGSRASNQVNNHIKYDDDKFPKEIVFERDYYIAELLGLLKKGSIKFPQKSDVDWLIDHCCSMEVKITKNRLGEPVRHFIKGATPNDGFMALLNAYIAWKFDVTQKFKIKNPAHMKYDITNQPQGVGGPIIGYCPNW